MSLQSIQEQLPTYVYRTEKFRMKKNHPLYDLIDTLSFKAKNLYNLALYNQRQCYFQHGKFMSYFTLYNVLKDTEAFKDLPIHLSQQTIKQVAETCNSFKQANKEYYKNPNKFSGQPKLPKYKDKITGRTVVVFDNTMCRIKELQIHFHKIMQGLTIPTRLSEINQVEIITKTNGDYVFYITGTKEIIKTSKTELKYIAGLDLGIDNFAAITVWNNTTQPLIINGKGLKSYNKNFNKQLAYYKSLAKTRNNQYTTRRIQNFYEKRNRYMDTWMHKASKQIVNYLIQNQVKHLVIGKNTNWKQHSKLSKVVNQTFIQLPYNDFIHKIIYKAQEQGITVYIVNEAYTSGTSFLDNESPTADFYNKSRRKYRGLLISNTGKPINADINASYQICKKAFPELTLQQGILTPQQLHNKLTPQIINVA